MQKAATIRMGEVSTIDYQAGMVSVTYPDRDGNTTKKIPLMAAEYSPPEEGDSVVVIHLSNGSTVGMVLGEYWCKKKPPFEGKKGLYRKELSQTDDAAVIRFFEDDGQFDIWAPAVRLESREKGMELLSAEAFRAEAGSDLQLQSGSSVLIQADGEITFAGAAGSITLSELIQMRADVAMLKGYHG